MMNIYIYIYISQPIEICVRRKADVSTIKIDRDRSVTSGGISSRYDGRFLEQAGIDKRYIRLRSHLHLSFFFLLFDLFLSYSFRSSYVSKNVYEHFTNKSDFSRGNKE